MIKGLKILHDMGIFHMNIKSANVFMSKDGADVEIGNLSPLKLFRRDLV